MLEAAHLPGFVWVSASNFDPPDVLSDHSLLSSERRGDEAGGCDREGPAGLLRSGLVDEKVVRELHVSPNTVRKFLRTDETDFSYKRERQPMPRIVPWQGKHEQFVWGNAGKPSRERLKRIRIFAKLRGLGYEDCYDVVRLFAKGKSESRGMGTTDACLPLPYAPGEA
jgi:hypothetical protein